MIIEVFDPFTESFILHFGKDSRIALRWNLLINNVSSLVKKYESIEDYPLGVYHLYFYLNNGRTIERSLLMHYYNYSEGHLLRWENDLEDEICREGQMINVTTSYDIMPKWVTGPLIGPKNDKWKTKEWEAKWDSSKKEDKVMTNTEIKEELYYGVKYNSGRYPYGSGEEHKMTKRIPEIKDVIFNNPATIVKWADGTKTVVKVQKGEPYDEEKGLAMAFIKKIYDNKGNYNDIFRKWCPKKEIPVVDDFNRTIEEMFEDLFADDFECENCKIDV